MIYKGAVLQLWLTTTLALVSIALGLWASVYGLAGTWFFCYRACLVSMAWLALVSISPGLWPNPMVCNWLVQPLSSIARSLSETPME